jgi:hypothetical protein
VKLGGYHERVVTLSSRYAMIRDLFKLPAEPGKTGPEGGFHFGPHTGHQSGAQKHTYIFALRPAFEKQAVAFSFTVDLANSSDAELRSTAGVLLTLYDPQ